MKAMDADRWRTLTLPQQLGNVASEFARFRHWFERGDDKHGEQAYERLGEIVRLTVEDPRWTSRRRELSQLLAVIRHLGGDQPELEVSFDEVEGFLMPFVVLARR